MTSEERDGGAGLSPIEEVIADARAGKLFVLVDDEDRENEGDLCVIGEWADAAAINFMAKYGRGLICLALTRERTEALGLSLMERRNESRHQTAFTVSIEAREGVTTGISAADRAHTIRTAIDPQCTDKDITTPGHIFPLVARDGGTLVRAGHTEAVVDIARAAGVADPSGVICEIMKDDGEMARLPDLIGFAAEHGLKIGSIADLIAYRRNSETLVMRTVETSIVARVGGDWRLMIFENTISGIEHIALIKGDISTPEPVLVRMHRLDLMSDVIGELSDQRSGRELDMAMKTIADAQRGIIVMLRESSKTRLSETISSSLSGGVSPDAAQGLREYGVGAQILNELGVSQMVLLSNRQANVISLEGYDLEITGWQKLEDEAEG
ncbi:MAG: 3,4-dihydroxy-2-butanone-4-phosphate synthase [Pseudomonadota bacterium]|nr:3,4-dihydroxy-2-butanone-4-phosphate synthase [Pseudomonadota bacterium]HCI20317.1 3,4-dihydroxy-2-butanone-4-phosphate synthase [Alphaproteobacteria bacterium]|tara:strand:+ start:724 stop:1872 length:1149 start_codon:yes stop_codon:yes gene_type:complete